MIKICCDKCGKDAQIELKLNCLYPFEFLTLSNFMSLINEKTTYHLCTECTRKLIRFLEEDK